MTFRKNYSNKFEVDDGLFDKKNRQMRRTFLLRMAVLRRFAYGQRSRRKAVTALKNQWDICQ